MNRELILERPPTGMTRAFAFTLATALAWIGHDCTGGCPAQANELPAAVWFAYGAAGDERIGTLVVVRFGLTCPPEPPTPNLILLGQVNDCVRRDHIHVRDREATTWDSALAILAASAGLPSPLPDGVVR